MQFFKVNHCENMKFTVGTKWNLLIIIIIAGSDECAVYDIAVENHETNHYIKEWE